MHIDEAPETPTWLTSLPEGEEVKYVDYTGPRKYLTALYTTVRVSVGEHDALNDTEMIFVLLTMFMGGVVMSYSITVLGEIIKQMSRNDTLFEEKMSVLDRIYDKYKIPLDLYTKLRRSIRYNAAKEK